MPVSLHSVLVPLFQGEHSDRDVRDPSAFSPKVRNLLPGPSGLDLRTPPGLVRLTPEGVGSLGQNPTSATWGRCALHLARPGKVLGGDLLGVVTQEEAHFYSVLFRRLAIRGSSKGVAASASAIRTGAKTYEEGMWADGGLTPNGFVIEATEIDEANPTTNYYDADATEYTLRFDEEVQTTATEGRRLLLRLGAMFGEEGTDPVDPAEHLLHPDIRINSAALRVALKSAIDISPTLDLPLVTPTIQGGLVAEWGDGQVIAGDALEAISAGDATSGKVGYTFVSLTHEWLPQTGSSPLVMPVGNYYAAGSVYTETSETEFTHSLPIPPGAYAAQKWVLVYRTEAGDWVMAYEEDIDLTAAVKARVICRARAASAVYGDGIRSGFSAITMYPFSENVIPTAVTTDRLYWNGSTLVFAGESVVDDNLVVAIATLTKTALGVSSIASLETYPYVDTGDYVPVATVDSVRLRVRRLDASYASDYLVKDEATWNVRKTGSDWTSPGGDYVGGTARDAILTSGMQSGDEVVFDVTADVEDYLDNAASGQQLQWLVNLMRVTDGAYWGEVELDPDSWTLLLEYEYDFTEGASPETPAEAGIQATIPWDIHHGPLSLPWLAQGAGLTVFGHAGARPRAFWNDSTFPAGIEAISDAPSLELGTGSALAAGTYGYRVTRYDVTLARNGASVHETEIVLSTADTVKVLSASFVESTTERYTHYRIWRRSVDVGGVSSAESYLVHEVTKSTAEGEDYYFEDDVENPEETVLTRALFAFPAVAGAIYHRDRFWAWGQRSWKLPGTLVEVADGSTVVGPGTSGAVFGEWMAQRTMLLEDSAGTWHRHLIETVFDDEGTMKLSLAEAFEDSEEPTSAHWELEGRENVLFVGEQALGLAEMFRMDGMTELEIDKDDGDVIVAAAPIGSRLLVYKRNAIYVVQGGDWSDAAGEADIFNDLDFFVLQRGVGLVGLYSLCEDAEGNHWFFDGTELRATNGEVVQDRSRGRLSEWLRDEVDVSRLEEVSLAYDPTGNQVWMVGFRAGGSKSPTLAVVYDIATDSICPMEDLYASCASRETGELLIGTVGGFWAQLRRDLGTQQVAVGAGTVTEGSATALLDGGAAWADDALSDAGLEVRVTRGDDYQVAAITGNADQTLEVSSWPDWTPARGDRYLLTPPGWRGALDGVASYAGDWLSLWDPDVTLHSLGDGLFGVPTVVVSASGEIGAAITQATGPHAWMVYNSGATGKIAFTPAAADSFVLGGWAWRWRYALTPSHGGEMVQIHSIVLDLEVDGVDGSGSHVIARIYSSETVRGAPTLVSTTIVDDAAGSSLLQDRHITLPRRWGRVVHLELAGVSGDQLVKVRQVEIRYAER